MRQGKRRFYRVVLGVLAYAGAPGVRDLGSHYWDSKGHTAGRVTDMSRYSSQLSYVLQLRIQVRSLALPRANQNPS